MKPAIESKTLWFNCFVIVLMVLQQIEVIKFIPVEIAATITASINMILRLFTGQPIK